MFKYRRHKKPILDDDYTNVQFFTPKEQEILFKSALEYSNGKRIRNFSERRDKDLRWFIRIFLGLSTGLRSGEISALKWKKINLSEGTLKVNRSVHYAEGDTKGEWKDPKTKKSYRTIKLDKPTIKELESYKIWVKEKLLKIGMKLCDFPTLPVIFSDDFKLLH